MIDKCVDFIAPKIYILMNMSAECAFCFLNLKIQGTFNIIRSSVSLFSRTANKDLISQFCARLECQASEGLNLLDTDIL
jgi:hypothetical protein